MHNRHSKMMRVTAQNCCPICRKPDWCLVSVDGQFAICPRVEEGSIKRAGEAGWLHKVGAEHVFPVPAVMIESQESAPKIDFEQLVRNRCEQAEPYLHDLACKLSVSVDALRSLQVGYNSFDQTFTFPERDGTGRVIGILRRYPDGSKRRLAGSKNGLCFTAAWDSGCGPVLLVEGPTDTAALMSLGCNAIGRPSNRGGEVHLAKLLANFPEERPIIVLGDNDQKASGLWPGKEGAIHTASGLARRLEREICWALPPDQAKDAREWLIAHGGSDPKGMQACFLDGLQLNSITAPPVIRTETRLPQSVELDDYRNIMLSRRLLSVDRPGVYLDRSTTGAGKSAIDFRVVTSLLGCSEELI